MTGQLDTGRWIALRLAASILALAAGAAAIVVVVLLAQRMLG